jgi:hypothetical protein
LHLPTDRFRAFAGRILWDRGDATPLENRWMAVFLRQNPIIKTKKQFHIDSARVNGATIEVIKKWWPKLVTPGVRAIKAENRYNMDEAGIMEGMGDNGLVVWSANKRFIKKKKTILGLRRGPLLSSALALRAGPCIL